MKQKNKFLNTIFIIFLGLILVSMFKYFHFLKQPEFPLIKIDPKNGIEKILTEKEAENLWKKSDQNFSGFTKLKSKIIMKYFPKIFEKRIMESAKSEYKSTPKEKNVW